MSNREQRAIRLTERLHGPSEACRGVVINFDARGRVMYILPNEAARLSVFRA